ncbi:MAG TPA: PKD domain-containing protein [Chitinophagaceae bacterium]|nr:PKD domain-containing protein [Chitinophagaceae bacterium]
MKNHLLTEVLNPIVAFFGYFKVKIITLKQLTLLLVLLSSFLTVFGQSYNNIEFIQNKGQWDSRVLYMGKVSNGAFFMREGGFTMVQHNPVDFANLYNFMHGQRPDGSVLSKDDNITVRSHAWDVDFIGASKTATIIPDKVLPTYNNYFIGNDPTKWAGDCKIYQAVTLKDIYPDIDVRYYTDNGFLKYDIVVKPGGKVSDIALKYDGVDKLQVKNKELLLSTSVGELRESSPYTYQAGLTGKQQVSCKYTVRNNIVRFDVKDYDPKATLIIDPSIIFCSFSGSTADNWGFTATYGPDGSMFGGGIIFETGFPASPGAFQTTYQGGGGNLPADIGIIKLTPDGSNRVYGTYIGGIGNEQPHSLIVDNQGNLIIAGRTNSPGTGSGAYPLQPTVGGMHGVGGGYDIIITKLNATGTALIGSARVGGSGNDGVNISEVRGGTNSIQRNYGDDGRSEVILDGAGNIYLASCTQSPDNFPVTPGCFQSTFGGPGSGATIRQDGVVLKFSPNLGVLNFASYLGGNGNDAAYVLSLGPGGNIYVAGGTESNNLPGNTAGTVGPSSNGNIDGFISVISNDGSTLIRTTYIGTSGVDQIFGIQFDNNGFPYITGQTTGSWPVTPGVMTFGNSNGKQFICKLQPDLSAYVYSTVFGTNSVTPNISITAFLVDRCENVYVSGWGGHYSPDNPYNSAGTFGLPTTSDAFKSSTDGKDFYFFVLKKDATAQLFGSFFGENNVPAGGGDHVDGGTSRFDKNGVIYQAICANCRLVDPRPVFPTTFGAWATTNNAVTRASCNLAMLKIAMNLAGVAGGVQSSINGVPRDSSGCVPLTVDFIDTIANAQSYEWNFGDGSPTVTTTIPSTSHTYNNIGNYLVMMIAIDPTTCNIRDTSYLHIRVGNLQATLDFNPVKLPPCDSFKYRFDNLSVPPAALPFGPQSFIWDFGDGSPRVTTGSGAVFHNYAAPGTYNVRLILPDTGYCNAPDSVEKQLSVADNVRARFTTPATGCLVYNAVFDNTSLAGQTWLWDFGDGTTSTAFEPVHTYTLTGTYNITLIAYNPNTCNGSDTARFTIQVFDAPVPDFSYSPITPIPNTPVTFNNLSSPDAVSFKWDFGDGDSLLTTSRAAIQHQYNSTGTFNVCLTAYNSVGCDSTICRPVDAEIIPVVDVPNAFTPLSGDINSIVKVQGFGIAKMQFAIWNRWGQKVFETNNRFQGWDGKVKGTVQPMDVYVYTLNVEFTDGTKTTKKGDITLIR